jgi:NUMOD4 motif/HNH endonuclease
MSEVWRDVPGWSGHYQVSDQGRVWSIKSNRLMKLSIQKKDNRYRVSLCRDGRQKAFFVQALVLEAFVGPRPPSRVARHLDGDVWNNTPANLEWGTASQNTMDKAIHGTFPQLNREVCPRDHRLIPPNLVKAALNRGWRNCLACGRASSYVHWYRGRFGVELDLKIVADDRYAKIMGEKG